MNCIVTLPPTPRKRTSDPDEAEEEEEQEKEGACGGNKGGISTQILPLSRLSSGNSPPHPEEVRKEVAASPVKEKLHRLRRSLAEPLRQYFHDLQVRAACTKNVFFTRYMLLNSSEENYATSLKPTIHVHVIT